MQIKALSKNLQSLQIEVEASAKILSTFEV